MTTQLLQLHSQLSQEKKDRKLMETEFETRIAALEKEREDHAGRMLIGTLGISFQSALTQKLTPLFPSEYAYFYTFDEITARVTKTSERKYLTILSEIENYFISQGILAEDIQFLIEAVCELGTSSNPFSTYVDSDDVVRQLTFDDMSRLINEANLPENRKTSARVLLGALVSVVPAGSDLLYSGA